jgi:hypothetical protein
MCDSPLTADAMERFSLLKPLLRDESRNGFALGFDGFGAIVSVFDSVRK